jgi:DNA-binding NarL/FixJ family response regulator
MIKTWGFPQLLNWRRIPQNRRELLAWAISSIFFRCCYPGIAACTSTEPALNRPRILLADDHRHLLTSATALLAPHFDVVGSASDGEALVIEALRLKPDVIVVDITMPVLSGIDAVRRLRRMGSTARIVFLTIHSEEEFVSACRAEGALAYVLKSKMKAHLMPAIRAALAGEFYICLT